MGYNMYLVNYRHPFFKFYYLFSQKVKL